MTPTRYNIRVYGILRDDQGRVLITDERRSGFSMTKFPGGGHDLGEGLGDALRREFMEEAETEVEVGELFYVNDFLQISAFNPKDQLISIYYEVRLAGEMGVQVSAHAPSFPDDGADHQSFRWVHVSALEEDDFRFPIDKIVVRRLRASE